MDLVLLNRYSSLAEAELAANRLRDAGIECVLQKDPMPGFAGVLVQGGEVYVNMADAPRAKVLLG